VLSCSYATEPPRSGGSPAKIWWLRGSERVEGHLLVLDSVRRQDDGRYTCVVDTGRHVLSADITVTVQCTLSVSVLTAAVTKLYVLEHKPARCRLFVAALQLWPHDLVSGT